jgi:uncharacterized membrane protein HdeD (DUF308 family)
MSDNLTNSAIFNIPEKMLNKYINSIKVEGILLIILGSIAILAPFFFARVLESFLGALFLFVGIIGLLRTISTRVAPGSIFSGLLYLLFFGTGLFIFIHPYSGFAAFSLIIGLVLMVSGFLKSAFAFKVKPASHWFWALLDGLITICLGGMIFAQWPFSGIFVISVMIGIKLLFLGYSLLMLSFGIKKFNSVEN